MNKFNLDFPAALTYFEGLGPPVGLSKRDLQALDDIQESPPDAPFRVLPAKKRRREARIVEAAAELFSGRGYEATSIEAIARRSDVAVGTVYNYFQNKPALLMRVLTTGRSDSIDASAAIVKDPPDDPVEAVYRLVMTQMKGATRHEKGLWRVIHGTAAVEPEAFGRDYFHRKEQFKDFISALLAKLRDRGRMAPDTNIEAAALTIKFVASETFRRYVVDHYKTIEEASAELRMMIEFIVGRTRLSETAGNVASISAPPPDE